MDERTVSRATERWVEADVIDEETAAAIRVFEAAHESGDPRQLTTVLAGMGSTLVGAGVLVSLAANWGSLSPAVRTAILVVVPVAFAIGGLGLDRRGMPRVGRGMWILATIAIGPSLLLLGELYAPGAEPTTAVLLWGLLAVPMGHAFRSRIGTGVGLLALLVAVVLSAEAGRGLVLGGFVATFLLGAAIPLRARAPALVDVYRLVGVGVLVAAVLWHATFGAGGRSIDVGLLAGIAASSIVVALAIRSWRAGHASRAEAVLVLVAPAGAMVLLGLHPLPDGLQAFLLHALLLGLLLAVALLAVDLETPLLVNLVVLGFFLQVASIVVTITDAISGGIALVVAGVVLLVAAIGLEHGRRELLERIRKATR